MTGINILIKEDDSIIQRLQQKINKMETEETKEKK